MNEPQYIVTSRGCGVQFMDLNEGRVCFALGHVDTATRFESEDAAFAAIVDYRLGGADHEAEVLAV